MKKLNSVRGSMTVEACYVVTLVAMTVLMCFIQCMLWHDKTVLEEEAWHTGFRGLRWVVENQDPLYGRPDWDLFRQKSLLWRILGSGADEGYLGGYAAENASVSLIICRDPAVSFSYSGNKSTVQYSSAGKMPAFSRLFGAGGKVSGRVSTVGTEPEEWVRISRGILFRGESE